MGFVVTLIQLLVVISMSELLRCGAQRSESGESKEALGKQCTSSASCYDGFCSENGVCACDPAVSYYNSEYNFCAGFVGSSCGEYFECGENSYCTKFPKVCSCYHGYFANAQRMCVLQRGPGGRCSSDSECKSRDKLVCQANGRCGCNNDVSRYDWFRNKCVGLVGAKCDDFKDCAPNSNCDEGDVCRCDNGYFPNANNVCEKKRPLRANCDLDSQCQSDLVCNTNLHRCACNHSTSIFDERSQTCKRKSGEQCRSPRSCVEHSVCRTSSGRDASTSSESPYQRCRCEFGYTAASNGTCIREEDLKICEPDDKARNIQCLLPLNSTCEMGNEENSQSVRERCVPNSACHSEDYNDEGGRCACNSGYTPSENGSCLVPHRHVCSHHWLRSCNKGLICREGICDCEYNTFQDYDENLKVCVSRVGGPCDESIPCTQNAQCPEGQRAGRRCECNAGYVSVDEGCKLAYGQPCQSLAEARTVQDSDSDESDESQRDSPIVTASDCESIGPLLCIDGICQCDMMEVYDMEVEKCRGRVGQRCSKENANYCAAGSECVTGRFSSADNGTCECQLGWSGTEDLICLPNTLG